MSFEEGVEVEERLCPNCEKPLFYETSFDDMFSPSSGHYTVDVRVIVCKSCHFCEELEPEEDDEPEYDGVE